MKRPAPSFRKMGRRTTKHERHSRRHEAAKKRKQTNTLTESTDIPLSSAYASFDVCSLLNQLVGCIGNTKTRETQRQSRFLSSSSRIWVPIPSYHHSFPSRHSLV